MVIVLTKEFDFEIANLYSRKYLIYMYKQIVYFTLFFNVQLSLGK